MDLANARWNRELPDAHMGTVEREVKYPVAQMAKGVACKSVERDG